MKMRTSRKVVKQLRPRYLKVEGLQSFTLAQEIDFDMLGETGLFGIFGPTGSGKSTILDAITLALYGNVQRANRGTQGIINTDSDSVSVSFKFDLLRYNQRKSYRVDRLYKRKKGSDNAAESKIARLFEICEDGERMIADKEREVTVAVIELIGLKLEDFTRSVVLPQNKFQEFLLLDKAQKRDMMERIFYLEEYGRKLTEKVNKKLSAVRYKLSNIEGAISALGDVSEKTLIEAESSFQKTKEMRESIDHELKKVEQDYQEKKEIWDLVQEQEGIERALKEHVAAEEVIAQKKQQYDCAKKADELLESIKKYHELNQKLASTAQQLKELYQRLPQIQANLAVAQREYDCKEKEAETQIPVLVEQKAKLNYAKSVKQEITVLEGKLNRLREDYTAIREQMKTKDTAIEKYKMKSQETESNIQTAKQNIGHLKVDVDDRRETYTALKMEEELKEAEQELEQNKAKINVLEDKVASLQNDWEIAHHQCQLSEDTLKTLIAQQEKMESQKPCDREHIMQQEKEYHSVESIYQSLKTRSDERQSICGRLDDINNKLKEQKDAYHKADTYRKELEVQVSTIQAQVEELKKQYETNTAYILAKALEEGTPCPVCGSEHHPSPADTVEHQTLEEVGQQLQTAQEQLIETEKHYRTVEANCIKLAEQLKHLQTQAGYLEQELSCKEQDYIQAMKSLPKYMYDMNLEQIASAITTIEQNNKQKLKDLEQWEQAMDKLKKEIVHEEQQISKRKVNENTKKAELTLNKENLAQLQQDFAHLADKNKQKVKTYQELLKKLGIENAGEEYRRIETNDRTIDKLQKEMEHFQKIVEVTREEWQKVAEERQQLANKYAEIETDGKHIKQQKQEKEQHITDLLGDKDIEQEITAVDYSISNLQVQKQQLLEKVQHTKEALDQVSILKSTLENQKQIYSQDAENGNKRLNAALQQKGFDSIEQAEQALMNKEQQELLEKEIKEYEDTLHKIKAQKDLVHSKLQGRSITEQEWIAVSEMYVVKKQQKEDSISQYESAKSFYNTIKDRFEQWVVLDKEYRNYNRKKDMLQQIQRLLKGNNFIEFISEERLRYIAKEASETLGVLTKYRYAIELDVDNGFVIRDNANGGACRFVSTLSGGETFLTSLSLALALSKQIQLKGQSPLEFFFLDEGFGTLDAALLDTVIDALERLSTTERVIGLISHVPEMKDRIARRLIVEPPTSNGKGSRVKVEKA